MHLIPMGDYYVWHCDWCDSTNHTIWTRVEADDLRCTACQKRSTLGIHAETGRPGQSAAVAGVVL